MEIADGTRLLVDGTAGTIETEPDADEADAPGGRRPRAARPRWPPGPAPAAPRTARRSSCSPTSPTARPPARRSSSRSRASGCSAPSCASSTAQDEPSVEEQADIYAEVLEPFGEGQYVVVRTLDAGSDKPIAFATLEGEENPALGVRGLRLSCDNPGLLDRQLDGIAEAAKRTGTETWVMAPMVATVAEAAGLRRRGPRPRPQGRA